MPAGGGERWALEGSHGGPLQVARIERDLAAMWKTATSRTGGTAVSRACASTLVVLCGEGGARDADNWVQEISRRHPCRVIVTETKPRATTPLEASAGAVCHLRPGGEGLICVEVIRIAAREDRVEALPSVVRSLAVGGLPLVLLAPDAIARRDPAFRRIAADADVVIVDSQCPADLLLDDADDARDLAWSRGSEIRGALARAAGSAGATRVLDSPRQVRIEHGGSAGVPASAMLLAGWLAVRLRLEPTGPDAGGGVRMRRAGGTIGSRMTFQPAGGEDDAPVAVTVSGEAGALEVRIDPEGAGAMVTTGAGCRRVALVSRTRAERVIREIHQHAPDPAFRAAQEMARRFVKVLEGDHP